MNCIVRKFHGLQLGGGYIDLILKVTSENDMNLGNNEIERSIHVKLDSPDLRIYSDHPIGKLALNQENNILAQVYNDGAAEAQNVIASLYLSEGYWNGSDWVDNSTLIDSRNIGNINVYGQKEINFSYTPTEQGWTNFKIVVSADNEAEEYKMITNTSMV